MYKVNFSDINTVYISPDKVRRRLSSSYYRGLVNRCSEAHKEIFCILNRFTNNGLSPLSDDKDDDPLKIRDPFIDWDNDESPIKFLEVIKKNPLVIKKVIKTLEFYKDPVIVTIDLTSEFFKGYLSVRMSGTPFFCRIS